MALGRRKCRKMIDTYFVGVDFALDVVAARIDNLTCVTSYFYFRTTKSNLRLSLKISKSKYLILRWLI